MAYLQVLDGNGVLKAVLVDSGDGSTTTPYIPTSQFLSGAFASGSVAAGAIAVGAIAAGATSIAANEDDASASGDRGVKMLAIQLATPADTAGTDADYSMLQMSGGRLWCSSVITGISGTVSLPTGASTAAKQPALGTAGTASADVISVQGIASMTPLLVTPAANSAVNVAQINGVTTTMGNGVSGTGVQRVTIASDSTGQIALAAGSAVVGHFIVDSGTVTTVSTVTTITNVVHVDDNSGSLTVDGTVSANIKPVTSGGLTLYSLLSTGTSGDATNVKASAGQLYWVYVTNTNAAVRYIKFYNSASAPTAGSGTPVLRLAIPGNAAGAGFHIQTAEGLAFSTGIGFTIVTTAPDAGSTGVAANEVIVNIGYA